MKNIFRSTQKRFATLVKKSPADMAVMALMFLAIVAVVFPGSASARAGRTSAQDRATALEVAAMQNETAQAGVLPGAGLTGEPDRVVTVSMTAYNSLPEQTDSTPFTTAMGSTTRHGVLAANFVPLGTYVKIPELYGDEVFIVEDRMNPRYTNRVDIWMEEYGDARQFGVKKNVTIEVYYE